MPKNKNWFRVYDRALDSPDILQLDDTTFRILFKLWCLASQGGREDGLISYVGDALQLRIAPTMPKKKFTEIVSRLLLPADGETSGLLREVNGKLAPRDWERHQFPFDSKKPSVRKQKWNTLGTDGEHIGNSSGSDGEQNGQQEKRREDKKREDKKREETDTDNAFVAALKLYQENIGIAGPIDRDCIAEWAESYPPNWIEEAVKEAVANNIRRIRYIDAILKNWRTEGFKAKKNGQANLSKREAKRAAEDAWAAKRQAELEAKGGQ